ncbi:MAG: PEP-CTERM sorting domain-containing protein [Luteolibacter sp.]
MTSPTSNRARVLAGLGFLIASTSALLAQTAYQTPSLQPLTGGWSSTAEGASLTTDFGPTRGTGSVTIQAIGGGDFGSLPGNPYDFSDWYPVTDATLSNGDTVHFDSAIIFTPNSGGATTPGTAGFSITFTLDSGVFQAGDVFAAGSLDYNPTSGRGTYFQPGPMLLAPDTTTIPADGVQPLLAIAGTQADPNGPLYTANAGTSPGGTSGCGLFRVAQDTQSFTAWFTATGASQGVVFTMATPVPEPTAPLLTGLAGGLLLFRRKRSY